MQDKSTLSIEKTTREVVKTVRRKMSYDLDKDLTTDEVIIELCNLYMNNHTEIDAEKEVVEDEDGQKKITEDD